jgi:hypothetical protein
VTETAAVLVCRPCVAQPLHGPQVLRDNLRGRVLRGAGGGRAGLGIGERCTPGLYILRVKDGGELLGIMGRFQPLPPPPPPPALAVASYKYRISMQWHGHGEPGDHVCVAMVPPPRLVWGGHVAAVGVPPLTPLAPALGMIWRLLVVLVCLVAVLRRAFFLGGCCRTGIGVTSGDHARGLCALATVLGCGGGQGGGGGRGLEVVVALLAPAWLVPLLRGFAFNGTPLWMLYWVARCWWGWVERGVGRGGTADFSLGCAPPHHPPTPPSNSHPCTFHHPRSSALQYSYHEPLVPCVGWVAFPRVFAHNGPVCV